MISAPARTRARSDLKSLAASDSEMWMTSLAMSGLYCRSHRPFRQSHLRRRPGRDMPPIRKTHDYDKGVRVLYGSLREIPGKFGNPNERALRHKSLVMFEVVPRRFPVFTRLVWVKSGCKPNALPIELTARLLC